MSETCSPLCKIEEGCVFLERRKRVKKAVVTGGLGFIGYHLSQALLEKGIEVISVDVRIKEKALEQEEKLMGMGRNALFSYVEGNLDEDNHNLDHHISTADAVFNLASLASQDSKWQTKHQTIQQATNWIQHICKQMKASSTLIIPSSVEVYGDVPGLITEETPLQPVSSYGIIKAAIEDCVKQQAESYKLTYQIVRLPTIYGPWQRPDMTFYQLISEQSVVYQDRSTLDILYVDDAVKGLLLAADSNHGSSIYHLSTGEEGQWFEAAKQLGAEPDVLKRTHSRSSLSPKKASEYLDFSVRVSIEEGIEHQKQHYHSWIKRLEA